MEIAWSRDAQFGWVRVLVDGEQRPAARRKVQGVELVRGDDFINLVEHAAVDVETARGDMEDGTVAVNTDRRRARRVQDSPRPVVRTVFDNFVHEAVLGAKSANEQQRHVFAVVAQRQRVPSQWRDDAVRLHLHPATRVDVKLPKVAEEATGADTAVDVDAAL